MSEAVDLSFLSETERDLILKVLQRDEELRKAEEKRIRELKKTTGDWFYDQKVNRFANHLASDLVRMSLRKKPTASKRDTVGQSLLQQSHLSEARTGMKSTQEPLKEFSLSFAASEPRDGKDSLEPESTSPDHSQVDAVGDTWRNPLEKIGTLRESKKSSEGPECSTSVAVAGKAEAGKAEADDEVQPSGQTLGFAEETEMIFKKNPRRALRPSEYTKSVMDLRPGELSPGNGSLGDRSRSVPGLIADMEEEEEEEEEDIDSLVEIHRQKTARNSLRSGSSLISAETLGSILPQKGELVVSLKYIPASKLLVAGDHKKGKGGNGGELQVWIKEAKNLTAAKSGGTSDSFVKGYLLPMRNKASKRKTPVVKKSLNPHYNHTFVYYGVKPEDLQHVCLELTVWDREPLASNDFLGGIRLGVGTGISNGEMVEWMDSAGEEVSLWQKMRQYPGSWAEGTLPLRPTMARQKLGS